MTESETVVAVRPMVSFPLPPAMVEEVIDKFTREAVVASTKTNDGLVSTDGSFT